MAIDVYLQIDGVKGESTDSTHTGWIEISSAHLGVEQPKSATSSTAGGHTAERCEHRSIALSKLADLSSPILISFALKFSKIKHKYTQQKVGGGAGGNTSGGWDLAANKVA